MKYNSTAIRKLIIEAFDDDDLTIFCHDHFSEVAERFSAGMRKDVKALQLVTYCYRHEQVGLLIDKIKAENSEKYEKYKTLLESGEEAPSILEEIRAETSEIAEAFEPMSRAESHRRRVSTETGVAEKTDHPLAGSSQEVKRWFVEKLDPEEQVFVVTAALFSGLKRQELMGLYDGVSSVLRPTETQAGGEA